MRNTLILFSFLLSATACKKANRDSDSTTKRDSTNFKSKKVIAKTDKPKHPLMPASVVAEYKTLKGYGDKSFYYKDISVDGDSIKAIYDYMDIDSLKIMGGFLQYSSYDSLISQIGTPDSSRKIDEFGYNFSRYFYETINFMMYDYNDLVYCNLIDFSNDSVFIKYDTLEFSSSTKIDDFLQLYPLSSLNFEHNRKYNNEIICDWFRFSPKANHQRSDQFIFLFKENKLRYFIYFDGND